MGQDTLLAALLADRVPEAWTHHVRAFYDETDVETLSDIVRSGAVTYDRLARGARACLPPGHETRRWLDDALARTLEALELHAARGRDALSAAISVTARGAALLPHAFAVARSALETAAAMTA